MSSAIHGLHRPTLGQITPLERRDHLTPLDPAARRQAEAILGATAARPKAAGS